MAFGLPFFLPISKINQKSKRHATTPAITGFFTFLKFWCGYTNEMLNIARTP